LTLKTILSGFCKLLLLLLRWYDLQMNERPRGGLPDQQSARRHKTTAGSLAGDAAFIAGVGAAEAAVGVAGITWRSHRELTHRSLELHPKLAAFFDLEQRSLGIADPTVWAAVHRIHHSMTDATLYPFYQIHHAIRAAKEKGMPIPDSFPHLDPYVDSFSRQEVEAIGRRADTVVQERLQEGYTPPAFRNRAEIEAVLKPKAPTYYYPKYDKHPAYTPDDLARILLTDPHSPALIARNGKHNGVQGVLTQNVFLYKTTADMFSSNPFLKPEDLKTGTEGQKQSARNAVIGSFALNTGIAFGRRLLTGRGGFTAKDLAISAAQGAAITGIKAGLEVAGGAAVNSFGHAGKLDVKELFRAATKRDYIVALNEDGSLTTDTVYAGALGRILGWITFDEVGGQAFHHLHPGKIKYSDKTGLAGWIDAPWGSFTEWLAESSIPLINPGKGFGDLPRPDVPDEGVLMIQKARAEQYRREQLELAA
jgi:hypothetical protein